MDIYASFGTSPTKEIEGVKFWLDLKKTAWVILARYNNPKMRDYFRRRLNTDPTYKRAVRGGGDDSGEMMAHLTMEAIVETVILDWGGEIREKGVKKNGKNLRGELIPYSKENAFRLCTDLPEFLDFVSDACQNLAAYQEFDDEDALGNYEQSSIGNESGAIEKTG